MDTLADTVPVFEQRRTFDQRNNLSSWAYGSNAVAAQIQRDRKDRIRGVQFDHGLDNASVSHGAYNASF